MFRFIGLLSIIPATVLLTISFFVIYATKKTEGEGLKKFGMTIAVLLWICSFLVFSAGVASVFCPRHGMMFKHHHEMMMKGDMKGEMPCCDMHKKGEHKKDMEGTEKPEKTK